MSPRERVRRLVDGELDPSEQAALWAEAERDEALRAALDEASVLAEALADLADDAPEPPPDLVDRAVLRAVRAKDALDRQPAWRRAWRGLTRPVVLRLRITPTAALVGLTALALVGVYALRPDRGALPVPVQASPVEASSREASPVAHRGEPVEAPVESAPREESMVEVAVRLMFPADDASTVAVAGDFNGWATDDTFLEDPEGDGVFTGTVRLPPGSYAYMFVVDGERWETDPTAVNHRDDGFGHRNAVLRID